MELRSDCLADQRVRSWRWLAALIVEGYGFDLISVSWSACRRLHHGFLPRPGNRSRRVALLAIINAVIAAVILLVVLGLVRR